MAERGSGLYGVEVLFHLVVVAGALLVGGGDEFVDEAVESTLISLMRWLAKGCAPDFLLNLLFSFELLF